MPSGVAAGSGLADAHVNLSAALAGMGRTPEAIRHAREALRLEPRHPKRMRRWGNCSPPQIPTRHCGISPRP